MYHGYDTRTGDGLTTLNIMRIGVCVCVCDDTDSPLRGTPLISHFTEGSGIPSPQQRKVPLPFLATACDVGCSTQYGAAARCIQQEGWLPPTKRASAAKIN